MTGKESESLFSRTIGLALCLLGFHRPGLPVRYVVEDSFHIPDVDVCFCERCGRRASLRFV